MDAWRQSQCQARYIREKRTDGRVMAGGPSPRGVWGVSAKIEGRHMAYEQVSFLEKYQVPALLLLLVLLGAFGVGLFDPRGRWPIVFLEHISMAFAVAGVLGLVIELTLQRDLAKNAFKAAIGYLLPEQLRGELEWIYNQSILCSEMESTINIEHRQQEGLALIKMRVHRTLWNVSNSTAEVNVSGGMDEWFFEGHPSKCIEAGYKLHEDGVRKPLECADSDDGIGWKAPTVRLPPNKKLDFWVEIEECRRENDLLVLTYRYPIENPRITILCPDTLVPTVTFDHRSKYDPQTQTARNTYQLRAMLLPHQDIRVKWHRKDLLEARRAKHK
jgi:hypothetical protein